MKDKVAIIVLSGGIKKGRNGIWRSTRFDEQGDHYGVQGNWLRSEAAAVLARRRPQSIVIASGGKGQMKTVKRAPTTASVTKQELIGLGIPKHQILSEFRSGATYGQLWLLPSLLRQKRISRACIVSNRHHLPRIRAMLQYHPPLRARWHGIKLRLIAAEDILVKEDPQKWKREIVRAYRSRAMKERMTRERNGIAMIQSGTYSYRIT